MGLYDNYKATYSQQVPTFAGSIVPELKAAKDQADQRYELAQEGIINLDEMKDQAPITPQDQANWEKINAEAEAKLDEWSARPDLENAVIDIHRYSKQVGNKLKTLALQKKARDEYRADIDKFEGVDQRTKEYYKRTADDAYAGGLQLDANGRPLNSYGGKAPVKSVDGAEKIQKALKILMPNEQIVSSEQDTEGGWWTVKTENGVKTVTAEQVLNAMRTAKAMDYEWQASDQQEHDVQLYGNTKTVTDDMVLNYLQQESTSSDPATIIRTNQIKELVAKGTPAADAFRTVESQRIKNNINNNEEAYALGATYRNTKQSRSVQDGPASKQRWELDTHTKKKVIDELYKDKEENSEDWIGKGAIINVKSWGETGTQLTEKLSKFDDISGVLNKTIQSNKAIAENPDTPLESKLRAQAEIIRDTKALENNQYRKAYIQQGQNVMMEKASQAEFKKPWSTIKAQDIKMVTEKVGNKDLAEALISGSYSYKKESKGGPTSTGLGSVLRVNGEVYTGKKADDMMSVLDNTDAKKVISKAKSMSTDGLAITTTQVPVKDEKDIKALKQVAKSLPLYDVSGSELVNLDDEDIDWSKTEVGTYIPELKMVSLQVTNGDKNFNVLADMSNFSFNKKVGSKLSLSSDPHTAALGQAIKSDNFQTYQKEFNQASGMITTIPGTNKPINIQGKPYGMLRNNDGSISLVDLNTKKIETDPQGNPFSSMSLYETTILLDKLNK